MDIEDKIKAEEQANENLYNLDTLVGRLNRHGLLSINQYTHCKELLNKLTLELGEVFGWDVSSFIKKRGAKV